MEVGELVEELYKNSRIEEAVVPKYIESQLNKLKKGGYLMVNINLDLDGELVIDPYEGQTIIVSNFYYPEPLVQEETVETIVDSVWNPEKLLPATATKKIELVKNPVLEIYIGRVKRVDTQISIAGWEKPYRVILSQVLDLKPLKEKEQLIKNALRRSLWEVVNTMGKHYLELLKQKELTIKFNIVYPNIDIT